MTLTPEARFAIQDLYARYNHAIDFGDAAGWVACFTPDGFFSAGTATFVGSEQLSGFATDYNSRAQARHWTNNLILEETLDGVKGICYLMYLRPGGVEGGPGVVFTGVYRDELIKGKDGWKFSKRSATLERSTP
jgi:hypothetical protein